MDKHELEKLFNGIVKDMTLHIIEYYSDSQFNKYLMIIDNFFPDNNNNVVVANCKKSDKYAHFVDKIIDSEPQYPIYMFLLHVYSNDEYKKKIKKGDDSFFMDRDAEIYYNSIGDAKIASHIRQLDIISEVKLLWNKFE